MTLLPIPEGVTVTADHCNSGASQTKGFSPLLDVFFPSIYQIFRASHNANRWRIINQMFAKSLPVDARVKQYHQVALFRLIWPVPHHMPCFHKSTKRNYNYNFLETFYSSDIKIFNQLLTLHRRLLIRS